MKETRLDYSIKWDLSFVTLFVIWIIIY